MYREIIMITVSELTEGMVLAENIYDMDGNILLASGIKLRPNYIKKNWRNISTHSCNWFWYCKYYNRRKPRRQDYTGSWKKSKENQISSRRSKKSTRNGSEYSVGIGCSQCTNYSIPCTKNHWGNFELGWYCLSYRSTKRSGFLFIWSCNQCCDSIHCNFYKYWTW